MGRVFLSYVSFRRSRQALLTRETRTKRDLFLVEDRSSRWYRFGSGLGFPGSLYYPTLQSVTAAHNLSKRPGCSVFIVG